MVLTSVCQREICALSMVASIFATLGCANTNKENRWSTPTDPTVERPQGDTGAPPDTETDIDTDIDVDSDTDSDVDSDTDADTGCERDPYTGEGSLALAMARILGEEDRDLAGYAVAGGGDLDGDGVGDVVVGAPRNSEADDRAGAVYLVAGVPTGEVHLTDALARIKGDETYRFIGSSVAMLVDHMGVSTTRLLIGTGNYRDSAVFLFQGPLSGGLVVSDADAGIYAPFTGEYSYFGERVRNAGDMDGDAVDDFLVDSEDDVWLFPGAVYGSSTPEETAIARLVPERFPCTCLCHYTYGRVGDTDGRGDLDGDGFLDAVVSNSVWDPDAEELCDSYSGIVYIAHGPLEDTVDLQADHVELLGATGQEVGNSVSSYGLNLKKIVVQTRQFEGGVLHLR